MLYFSLTIYQGGRRRIPGYIIFGEISLEQNVHTDAGSILPVALFLYI